jgi:PAS domain S-box-containing protein
MPSINNDDNTQNMVLVSANESTSQPLAKALLQVVSKSSSPSINHHQDDPTAEQKIVGALARALSDHDTARLNQHCHPHVVHVLEQHNDTAAASTTAQSLLLSRSDHIAVVLSANDITSMATTMTSRRGGGGGTPTVFVWDHPLVQHTLTSLADSSKDAIFLMKEDIFIDCNKAAISMFETTEEEVIGESPLKFSPLYQPSGEESEQLIKNKIQQAMQGDSLTFDFTHISGKGVTFETEISLNKVILKESTFIQAIARDITSRKKSEKDLLFAKEKAEESDYLKTAFLASMSHEIRTPMNHILGGLDLLLDPDISAEEKEEFHNIIKKSRRNCFEIAKYFFCIFVIAGIGSRFAIPGV